MRYIKLITVILITDYIFYSPLDIKKCDPVYVFGTTRNCSSRNVTATTVAETTPIKITANSTASPQQDFGDTAIILIPSIISALILILILVLVYIKRDFFAAFIRERINTVGKNHQVEDKQLTSVKLL